MDAREPEVTRERALLLFLLALTAVLAWVAHDIARPFLAPLAWAVALAVLLLPAHRALEARVRPPELAAGLAVALAALLVLLPTLFVLREIGDEVVRGAGVVQAEVESGRWREAVARSPRLRALLARVEAWVDVEKTVAEGAKALGPRPSTIVLGPFRAAAELLVTLFSLFYLFRDRREAIAALRSLVPLPARDVDEVFARVADTIHAILYGTLVVALVQGALGGLIFWWLGLPSPLLWGVVMGLLAIVPVLGTFVVWIPAAALLALQGEWGKALVLTLWGGVVIALIDNLLYPILVGKKLRFHTLPVFIAIVGGVARFGASGLILGPVVLALVAAVVEIWRRRLGGGHAAGEWPGAAPPRPAPVPEAGPVSP